jgi:beta-glucosidase
VDDIYMRHKLVATAEEASAQALTRGCDLECGSAFRSLGKALEQGLVREEDLDVAVRRLMLARMRLGMFDPPERVPYAQVPYSANDALEHDRLARRVAQESIVVLKNDGVLPLRKDVGMIAVVGPTADDVTTLLGNYNGTPSHPVTVLAGITAAVSPGTRVFRSRGVDLVDGWQGSGGRPRPLEEIVKEAGEADVIVFVGGLSPELEGEEMKVPYPGFAGGDRTDLELPASQQRLLEALHATGKPVVLVLTTGSALAVRWAKEHLPAIVVAWYPGQRGGSAVADVLFGDANPAGRLPVTFYASADQLPPFADYAMEGRTYRYFRGEPLYPFGHGLSYTRFEYSGLSLSRGRLGAGDRLEVWLDVTNAGGRDGDEVVQLYARDVESRVPVAIRQLRGFERVRLKAGETRRVRFEVVPERDLVHWDVARQRFAVEPGEFEIEVGACSRDIRLRARVGVE